MTGINYGSKVAKEIYLGTPGAGSRLPSAYQEVEYIQSSGTQWINTGYVGNSNTGIKTKLQFNSATNSANMFQVGNGAYRCEYYTSPYLVQMLYNNGSSTNTQIKIGLPINTPHTLVCNDEQHNWYVNGVLEKSATTPVYVSNVNITLFSYTNGEGKASGKIWYFQIYDSGNIVRDLVPCYRKSDNVIGMYDLVNNTFYTNSGSGTFTKGANVTYNYTTIKAAYYGSTKVRPASRLPGTYQEVEYIQSSGSQYINTGYTPSSNTNVEIGIAFTSARSGWSGIFGAQTRNDNYSYALGISNNGTATFQRSSSTAGHIDFTFNPSLNQKYVLKTSGRNIYIDGVNKGQTSADATFNCSYTARLFSVYQNSSGGFPYNVPARIYTCKVYTGTTLERDFVPCYRTSDNVIGLYDLVNKQFYTNSGSGTFTKGADVN